MICLKMGFRITEKREDLEQRYDMIEDLYEKNKITTESLPKIKTKDH